MPCFLDVAIEHRRVRAQAELVSFAVNANPGIGVGFVLANLVADFGMENLCAAARQTAEPGRFEFKQQIASGSAGETMEPIPFDCGVGFQM